MCCHCAHDLEARASELMYVTPLVFNERGHPGDMDLDWPALDAYCNRPHSSLATSNFSPLSSMRTEEVVTARFQDPKNFTKVPGARLKSIMRWMASM